MGFRNAGPDRLLERASELASLEQAIMTVAGGMPRVVLLAGAAGIGKTALLSAARHRAEAAGLKVLTAQGGELGAPGCHRRAIPPGAEAGYPRARAVYRLAGMPA